MVKGMKILLSIFLVISSFVAVAQEQIGIITPCVDSVLTTIKNKAVYKPLDVTVDDGIRIVLGDSNIVLQQEQVIEWLEGVKTDSLRGYKLSVDESNYYIFSSDVLPASGLANNFTIWLIVDVQLNLFIDFNSLSQNPKLIYFNQETNKLSFVRFIYGEHFFWKRDWDNVDFKMGLNEIDNGELELVSSKNSWCSEN